MNKEYVVELFNIYGRDRCIIRTEVVYGRNLVEYVLTELRLQATSALDISDILLSKVSDILLGKVYDVVIEWVISEQCCISKSINITTIDAHKTLKKEELKQKIADLKAL